jgi:hypothetical protein
VRFIADAASTSPFAHSFASRFAFASSLVYSATSPTRIAEVVVRGLLLSGTLYAVILLWWSANRLSLVNSDEVLATNEWAQNTEDLGFSRKEDGSDDEDVSSDELIWGQVEEENSFVTSNANLRADPSSLSPPTSEKHIMAMRAAREKIRIQNNLPICTTLYRHSSWKPKRMKRKLTRSLSRCYQQMKQHRGNSAALGGAPPVAAVQMDPGSLNAINHAQSSFRLERQVTVKSRTKAQGDDFARYAAIVIVSRPALFFAVSRPQASSISPSSCQGCQACTSTRAQNTKTCQA